MTTNMTLNFPSIPLRLSVSYLIVVFLLTLPVAARAQTAQLLSVSPTLFEMSAVPGQSWTSALKVVNPNPYELTVYVSVVNFAPKGEGGDGTLIPVLETDTEGATLAEWVSVDTAPITIAKEGTVAVPFTVLVPDTAAPGGHFAALLVGTKPPADTSGAAELRTAQVVTSLFFLRVAGEVNESGVIREFTTERSLYGSPRAVFALRFQNNGNVHLRPQGDITITNMWGQERGIIPINRQNHFGNVLPDSIRKFSFSWEGEWSFSDIGRHKAIVTLAYGQDARQFVTSTTYFWFLPIGPALGTLAVLVTLVSALIWLVRLYVRRLLVGAGFYAHARQPYIRRKERAGDLALSRTTPAPLPESRPLKTGGSFLSYYFMRVCDGYMSLYRVLKEQGERLYRHVVQTPLRELVALHWRFILIALLCVILLAAVVFFIRNALTPQRSYTVTYEGEAGGPTVSSDEIMFEEKRDQNTPLKASATTTSDQVMIDIVNVSGIAGAAATVALILETQGYTIGEVTTDLSETQGRTVIVYEGDTGDIALTLSRQLNNALLSAYNDGERSGAPVTLYLGADIASQY
jgi:hypothetical protein